MPSPQSLLEALLHYSDDYFGSDHTEHESYRDALTHLVTELSKFVDADVVLRLVSNFSTLITATAAHQLMQKAQSVKASASASQDENKISLAEKKDEEKPEIRPEQIMGQIKIIVEEAFEKAKVGFVVSKAKYAISIRRIYKNWLAGRYENKKEAELRKIESERNRNTDEIAAKNIEIKELQEQVKKLGEEKMALQIQLLKRDSEKEHPINKLEGLGRKRAHSDGSSSVGSGITNRSKESTADELITLDIARQVLGKKRIAIINYLASLLVFEKEMPTKPHPYRKLIENLCADVFTAKKPAADNVINEWNKENKEHKLEVALFAAQEDNFNPQACAQDARPGASRYSAAYMVGVCLQKGFFNGFVDKKLGKRISVIDKPPAAMAGVSATGRVQPTPYGQPRAKVVLPSVVAAKKLEDKTEKLAQAAPALAVVDADLPTPPVARP